MVYQIDDYVVFGSYGVCQVKVIGHLDIGGTDKERIYYTLEPQYSKGSLVYSPIDNARVPMRSILTRAEAMELISDISDLDTMPENALFTEQGLKEMLRTQDSREWVRIIKSLYEKKKERLDAGKKNTSVQERFLKEAENNLYGELAFSLQMPREKIQDYVIEAVKNGGITINN
ncbi:MAG: CarD family transcriptional regulator [Vallitaleaceae bacterium]|nr:CarD family transcriptional regulator [Vallitaleaceae bacterium]